MVARYIPTRTHHNPEGGHYRPPHTIVNREPPTFHPSKSSRALIFQIKCFLSRFAHLDCVFVRVWPGADGASHHRSLLTSRSGCKRESCVSSTTTTTVLVGPTSSYAVHHRDVNGGGSGGGVSSSSGIGGSLPMSAMPKAISPLMKVCVVLLGRLWHSICVHNIYVRNIVCSLADT